MSEDLEYYDEDFLEEMSLVELITEELIELQKFHEKVKEKLYVGMVIKNYKELCQLLNLEEKNGCSKKAQMHDLERYFSYDKKGQKIIVTGIRDLPLPKTNYRGQHKGYYVQHIEKIVLDILSKTETIRETKSRLLPMLGMTNTNFTNISFENILKKEKNFSPNDIRDFKEIASRVLGENLYSALKSMDERFLIVFEPKVIFYDTYVSCKENEEKQLVTFEANTVEDKDKYSEAVLLALKTLNKRRNTTKFKTLRDVFSYRETKTFYSILNNILANRYDWYNVTCYMRISAREDALDLGIEIVNKEYEKLQLNKKCADRMHKALQTELTYQCKLIEATVNEKYNARKGLRITEIIELEKDIKKEELKNSFDSYEKLINELITINESLD